MFLGFIDRSVGFRDKMEVNPKPPKIPTVEEADVKIKSLCLKLIAFPECFTLGELATLQELMENEGYPV